ncbi:hypothetical protein CAJAP_09048 [Camponotus japonicus]
MGGDDRGDEKVKPEEEESDAIRRGMKPITRHEYEVRVQKCVVELGVISDGRRPILRIVNVRDLSSVCGIIISCAN